MMSVLLSALNILSGGIQAYQVEVLSRLAKQTQNERELPKQVTELR